MYRKTGLFRSHTSFITTIAQRTKIIKLNHLYLYDIQTDHIYTVFYFRSIVRLLFLFMASNEDLNMKAKKARTFFYFSLLIFLRYILVGI